MQKFSFRHFEKEKKKKKKIRYTNFLHRKKYQNFFTQISVFNQAQAAYIYVETQYQKEKKLWILYRVKALLITTISFYMIFFFFQYTFYYAHFMLINLAYFNAV